MRWLLRLYPRDWRRRYGAEMETHLADAGGGWRETLDLIRGAYDARLNPQWPYRRPLWPLLVVAAALAVVTAPLLGQLAFRLNIELAFVQPGNRQLLWDLGGVTLLGNEILTDLALTAACAWLALLARLIGWRLLAWLGALVALRTLVMGVVWYVGFAYADQKFIADAWKQGWMPMAANLLDLTLWALVAAALLRRVQIPWPFGIAIGCALELLLGSNDFSLASAVMRSHWFFSLETNLPGTQGLGGVPIPNGKGSTALLFPGRVDLDRLPRTIWAAVLAVLIVRRRRGFGQPPAGAGVPAAPIPDSPAPTVARVNR
jgi:hypothetical protein